MHNNYIGDVRVLHRACIIGTSAMYNQYIVDVKVVNRLFVDQGVGYFFENKPRCNAKQGEKKFNYGGL